MKFLRSILIFLFLIILLCISILIYRGHELYKNAIEEISIEDMIDKLKSSENYTTYQEIPKDYINAVVAVEDKRFFKHNGVDLLSIGRALCIDIYEKKFKEGGSTITQQLAKNVYFTQEKQLTRKIAEIFVAFDIEKKCSKEEIFELYVNNCYYGDGYYCIRDACNGYFDKQPNEMNLYESTLLAGIPNAPSVYAPTKNPELAKERQIQVLNKMKSEKYITQEQIDILIKEEN